MNPRRIRMIKLGYFGHERCDIMYYLLRGAQLLNKKVLVLDNSISGDFFRSLSNEEDVDENAMITLMRNYHITNKDLSETDFDVFIYYGGLAKDYKPDYRFDKLFVVPTQSSVVITDTKAAISGILKENVVFIYDDVTKQKITFDVLKMEFGFENYEFNSDEELEIALDETRIFKYETLSHVGEVALKGNSKEFSNIIFNMIIKIFDVQAKEQIKLLKKRL